MKVVWLMRARVEMQKAIDYIARDSRQAALGQLHEIERQTDLLFDFPEIGRAGRRRGTRELVIAGTPFLAIYRISAKANEVQILRLMHGAQRWPPRKRPDADATIARIADHDSWRNIQGPMRRFFDDAVDEHGGGRVPGTRRENLAPGKNATRPAAPSALSQSAAMRHGWPGRGEKSCGTSA